MVGQCRYDEIHRSHSMFYVMATLKILFYDVFYHVMLKLCNNKRHFVSLFDSQNGKRTGNEGEEMEHDMERSLAVTFQSIVGVLTPKPPGHPAVSHFGCLYS